MKKQLLFLSLLLLFGSAVLWATTPPKKVEMAEDGQPVGQERSMVLSPQITFYADQSMLEIRFYSEQYVVLKVADAAGSVVSLSQLITDGGTHSYMLPTLQAGNYSLTIESASKTYRGELSVR